MTPGWGLALAVTALAGPAAPPNVQGQEVRDSLGIEIVSIASPEASPGRTWRISETPRLQIGAVAGEDPYLFTRVWDALRVPDGRIVMVEGTTFEIRVFSPEGDHENTFGRRGDGPAEFSGPPWIALNPPGTLVAWDPGHHRLSHFTLSGDLLDQHPLVQLVNSLSIAPLSNGRVWQVGPSGMVLSTRSSSDGFPGGGLKEESRRVVLVDGIHENAVELGTYPAGRTLWERKNDGGLIGLPDPYAPFSAVTLGPEPFLVSIGDATRWEIRSFGRDGTLLRIFRASPPPTVLTGQIKAQENERTLNLAETMGMSRLDAGKAVDRFPVPDAIPPIGSLFWDTSGNLWVGHRAGTYLEAPRDYDVFDIQGHWLASVEIPESLGQVFEVGEDYVLASWQDEMDVVYLRLCPLLKAPK